MLPFKNFRGSAPNPAGGLNAPPPPQTPTCKAPPFTAGYAPVPRELVFSKTEADCLSQEVESLVQKEVISEISMLTNEMLSEKGYVSQLFAVPKKDGGIRPVVNLKVLNSYVKQVSFTMEGIHLLKDLLCPGDLMTKVDLKDAYFAIPLNCQDRKLLRFQ